MLGWAFALFWPSLAVVALVVGRVLVLTAWRDGSI